MKLSISFILICLSFTSGWTQDRNLGHQYNFPDYMLLANGGRAIDVTAPPFSAQGDGTTDDTRAFIEAYNYLVTWLEGPEADLNPDKSLMIYIPDGEYLVSNTIIYDGDPVLGYWHTSEGITKIRFIGQSRENTVIRLKDNSPGFESGASKPVISFGKMDFNNIYAANAIRNLTINTGAGNPGAVGVRISGANNSGAKNLLIKSSDGLGTIGLDFSIATTVGYFNDITIDGFDYGIRLITEDFVHPTLEYFTLINSGIAGVYFENLASASLRKILIQNEAAGIVSEGMGNMVTIVDSRFDCQSDQPAIQMNGGYLFARNIKNTNGLCVIEENETCQATGDIDEYVTGPVVQYSTNIAPQSLNLPIEEVPLTWTNDTTQWANVDAFGAVGDGINDDAQAIQAAFNSGKPMVIFPKFRYRINSSITIPATVNTVAGMFSYLEGEANQKLVVNEASDQPLNIIDLRIDGGWAVVQDADRSVVMDNIRGFSNPYCNGVDGLKPTLFVNNCTGFRYSSPFKNVKAYVRFINTEARNTQFLVDNSQVVVLGYKTEKHHASFEATNGAKLEILGGQSNQMAWDNSLNNPVFINRDSEISINAGTARGFNEGYQLYIQDYDRKFYRNEFPKRTNAYDVIRAIPLYVHSSNIITGSSKPPNQEFKIYPNPVFDNHLNFEINPSLSNYRVEIIDLQGQVLANFSLTEGENKIDLSILKEGLYSLRAIINEHRVVSRKIIVRKN